jgi:hypothetical protein
LVPLKKVLAHAKTVQFIQPTPRQEDPKIKSGIIAYRYENSTKTPPLRPYEKLLGTYKNPKLFFPILTSSVTIK